MEVAEKDRRAAWPDGYQFGELRYVAIAVMDGS
jgi:hypothetical protein